MEIERSQIEAQRHGFMDKDNLSGGDDLVWSSRFTWDDANKFPSENHYRIRCDGLPHRVQCGKASCMTSCAYVDASHVEGATASPEGATSYWTREVSSDGKELRISEYQDKAKQKLKGVQVADRLK